MEKFAKVRLGDIAEITMGQSPKSEFYNSDGEGLPFLQGNRTFGFKYPEYDTYTSKATKIGEINDVIMSVRAPVGDLNIIQKQTCLGRGVCSLRMKNGLNDFLYYLMKHNAKHMINKESGTVFGSVNKNDISNLEVMVPRDVETQKKIANILSDIDAKIELNNKLNANFAKMGQDIFKSKFIDFEGVEQFVESEQGLIPAGWRSGTVGVVAKIIRGASPRPIQHYMSESGRPWLKISDATSSPSKFVTETAEFIIEEGISKSRTVKPGQLILSNSATPGLPMIMDIEVSVHDGWLIFDEYKDVSKEYMYYFLLYNREKILSLSNGSVFRNLKTDILKTYKIIIPSRPIIDEMTTIFQAIDKKILALVKENNSLQQLRDTLIPKLMNGEIDLDSLMLDK